MIKIEEYNNSMREELTNLSFKAEDVNEMIKVSGIEDIKEIIKYTIETYGDRLFVIKYNDNVSGVFGVVPDPYDNKIGIGIFLTDNNIENYKKELVKNSTIAVEYFLETYDIIYNYCPASYDKSLRWLEKTCGAIVEEKDYYFNGEKFRRFFISKETLKNKRR